MYGRRVDIQQHKHRRLCATRASILTLPVGKRQKRKWSKAIELRDWAK